MKNYEYSLVFYICIGYFKLLKKILPILPFADCQWFFPIYRQMDAVFADWQKSNLFFSISAPSPMGPPAL